MKGNVNSRWGRRPGSGRRGRHAAKSRLSRVLALFSAVAISGGLMVALAGPAAAAKNDTPKKVWVCKYVGTPGAGERLQTGDNPITVSVNSIKVEGTVQPGDYFPDAHGRSYVIGFQTPENTTPKGNSYVNGIDDCPPADPGTGSATVTLTKVWVLPDGVKAEEGDEVTLTVSAGAESTQSVRAVQSSDSQPAASIQAEVGATVTLSETHLSGYTSVLSCSGASPVNGKFRVVSSMVGATISCTYTNTHKPAESKQDNGSLVINKIVKAPAGFYYGGEQVFTGQYTCSADSEAPITGTFSVLTDAPASVDVPAGMECTVTENIPSDKPADGFYWDDPVYNESSVLIAADQESAITITNSILQGHATVALFKVWEGGVDGDRVALTIAGAGMIEGAGATGQSTVPEDESDKAAHATVAQGTEITLSESYESGAKGQYQAALDCMVDGEDSQVVGLNGGLSGTFEVPADAEHVTCTFTNTHKTGGDEGTPPGNTPNTPTDTTPQIVVQGESNAKPPIVVKGVSQELPPAPVIKVKPAAQVAPAPSANAHTGQGQSPWVYLLFGAGALLMLGAWRVRRNGNA